VNSFTDQVQFIWSIAEFLRGLYEPPQCGRVILPLIVLRRLNRVLAPTKDKVLAKAETLAACLDRIQKTAALHSAASADPAEAA